MFLNISQTCCILQLVSVDELRDDSEFGDIYQDIHDECTKYGKWNHSIDGVKILVRSCVPSYVFWHQQNALTYFFYVLSAIEDYLYSIMLYFGVNSLIMCSSCFV